MLGCISTELDVDIKKVVLFLDKIIDVAQNEETLALFTLFIIKLKQICYAGHVSLCKRIKTNREVKRIEKSGNENTDLDLQEAETEEVTKVLEIDKDENIFDILSLYRS